MSSLPQRKVVFVPFPQHGYPLTSWQWCSSLWWNNGMQMAQVPTDREREIRPKKGYDLLDTIPMSLCPSLNLTCTPFYNPISHISTPFSLPSWPLHSLTFKSGRPQPVFMFVKVTRLHICDSCKVCYSYRTHIPHSGIFNMRHLHLTFLILNKAQGMVQK